ncbi:MAG TPA: spondin domain-containing protein [Psychromonas sp.]
MKNINRQHGKYLALLALTATLAACHHNNDNSDNAKPFIYEVTLLNITQGQIFSPPALMTHAAKMKLWQAGETASLALEKLAEGGDASELSALSGIHQSQISGTPVTPGDSISWTLEIKKGAPFSVSLATMLINTNDGFTGFTDMDLSSLALGDSYQKMLAVYDAGTEMNNEVAVPGLGGEGFNASRIGDVNRVYVHAGVLTTHELSGSNLLPEHKFDNPAGKLTIKRMQ